MKFKGKIGHHFINHSGNNGKYSSTAAPGKQQHMDSELDVYVTHKHQGAYASPKIKASMGLSTSDHTAEVTAPHIASCSTYDFNSKQPIAVIPNP